MAMRVSACGSLPPRSAGERCLHRPWRGPDAPCNGSGRARRAVVAPACHQHDVSGKECHTHDREAYRGVPDEGQTRTVRAVWAVRAASGARPAACRRGALPGRLGGAGATTVLQVLPLEGQLQAVGTIDLGQGAGGLARGVWESRRGEGQPWRDGQALLVGHGAGAHPSAEAGGPGWCCCGTHALSAPTSGRPATRRCGLAGHPPNAALPLSSPSAARTGSSR
jgi:hypothetical protein